MSNHRKTADIRGSIVKKNLAVYNTF